MQHYTIHKTDTPPDLTSSWEAPGWNQAEVARIAHFHPESSAHQPAVEVKALHDNQALYLFFRVQDQYVRAVHQGYQQQVCKDSCVEFFFQPRKDTGYFNIEINCIGAILTYYITPETRQILESTLLDRIEVHADFEGIIDPEIPNPTTWTIRYKIPVDILEKYTASLRPLEGSTWRGNFYKCADATSHPHWASWAPIGHALNFHQPEYFGAITFGA